MKKHLIMIIGGYYPTPSATARCAEDLIQLIQDQYDIDIVCLSRANNIEYEYMGKKVYPAGNRYSHLQYALKKNQKTKLLYHIVKAPVYWMDCFRHPNNLHWYVKAAYQKLEELHAQKPIDVVFSVGAPMASHCAAMRFQKAHPQVRWVTYTVDSYAAQNANRRRFRNAEKKTLQCASYNLLSEEIYDNSPFLYEGQEERFAPLPYLLPPMEAARPSAGRWDENKINLVYAGSFYKKIRNPQFLLEMMLRMPEDVVLHLYCTSDCDACINQYAAESAGRIVRHPTVGPDEIQAIYAEADVLVNVGNSLREFKPSKTFEYIAARKPILHLYYPEQKDEVLQSYPLALQICMAEEPARSASAAEQFLRAHAGEQVSQEEIRSGFGKYLPENIAGILNSAIRG